MNNKKYMDMYGEKLLKLIEEKVDKATGMDWLSPVLFQSRDVSVSTGKPYKGFNQFALPIMRKLNGWESRQWITMGKVKELQAKNKDVRITKGSKMVPVYFWKPFTLVDGEGNPIVDSRGRADMRFMFKVYYVFNTDCIEGYDFKQLEEELPTEKEVRTMEEWDEVMLSEYRGKKPELLHDGDGGNYYKPSTDSVHLTDRGLFRSSDEYLSTLAHELVHSTGHKDRLDRVSKTAAFGSEDYGLEELTAEMGASMICARHGVLERTIDNQAEYLKNWMQAIKKEPSMLARAFSKAEKAVAWIEGKDAREYTEEQ